MRRRVRGGCGRGCPGFFLIFEEVSKSLYNYIIELEITFLMKYKLNPFDLLGNVTLLDLESYMQRVDRRLKDEEKSPGRGKDLGRSLAAIRDILNCMEL